MDDEMSNKTEATFHPATDAGPPGTASVSEPDPLLAEHWSAGEWPTGQLPIWADLTARHGSPAERGPDFGAAGMHTWDDHRAPSRWVGLTLLLVGLAVVAAVLLGVLAYN